MSPAQLLGISPQTVTVSIFLVEEALEEAPPKDWRADLIRTRQELEHLHRLLSPQAGRLDGVGLTYTGPRNGQRGRLPERG